MLACCCATNAFALTFTEAMELARKNDPVFLSAQANKQAAKERSNIAFASLLPQINFSGNTARNDRKYVTRTDPETIGIQQFGSRSAQFNLTQGLWRAADRIASTQADLAAQQGETQVMAAEQDLFVRFLQAWLDLMSARDNIEFTVKQSAAASKLVDQTTRAAQLGLVSEPEIEDALARFERAGAEQIAAEADQEDKISSLEQIIGATARFEPPSLSRARLPSGFPDMPLSQWLELAENANPGIIAATYAARAANEEIRKQQAGHQPTLDLTASYGRTSQGVGTTPRDNGYANTQATIGLQLNIPIYSGGGQSAKVREAIALREKAAQDLETARRNVRSAGRQAWFGIQSGIAREKAAAQAVKSASAAIRLATSGRQRELKTDLDVMQATQQLYMARRDMRGASYAVMLSRIKLKAASGQLTAQDVLALSDAFGPSSGAPVPAAERSPTTRHE